MRDDVPEYELVCSDSEDVGDIHGLLAYRFNPKLVEIANKYRSSRPTDEALRRYVISWINEYDGARILVIEDLENKSFEDIIVSWLFNLRDQLTQHRIDFDSFKQYITNIAALVARRNPAMFSGIRELIRAFGCDVVPKEKRTVKVEHVVKSFIDTYVDRFIVGTDTCRTVDCVLVNLSLAFSTIRDFTNDAPSGGLSEHDLIHCFLNHPRIMMVLAGLASGIDVVEAKIQRDVRFRDLRPYLHTIMDAIRGASQTYTPTREFATYERPSPLFIEYEELRGSTPLEHYREATTAREEVYKASVERGVKHEEVHIKRKPTGCGRRSTWRLVVGVVMVAVLLLWVLPHYVPTLQRLPLPSPTEVLDHISNLTAGLGRTRGFELDDTSSFIRSALSELNKIRQSYGIPPVSIINLSVAEWRAEYMATRNYLSHYDVEGRHPNYYYTLLDGGLFAVEENGYACLNCNSISASDGERMTNALTYRDAESAWGHRDSLLDPCNNYVAIGVARNSSNIYATAYMVSRWVEWAVPPTYRDGVFYAKGLVKLPPSHTLVDERPFYYVMIYRDVPDSSNYYKRNYSYGGPYAGILPADYPGYYQGITTLKADIYRVEKAQNGWLLEIRFKFTPPDKALYTIVITSKSTGITWEPMSPGGEYRLKYCEILAHTIQG